MKKKHIAVLATIMFSAILFCSMARWQATSIKGTVNPPGGASQIWAMSSTETYRTIITDGKFELKNIKAGTYNLEVKGIAPYKDAVIKGVQVIDGVPQVDVGEIKLEK